MMFIWSPYLPVVDGRVLHVGPDARLAILDERDDTARAILRTARRCAAAEWRGQDGTKELDRLERIIDGLPMDQVNTLAVMWMISNKWHGATGQGGIWAMASKIVNETARRVLRTRPAFEIVR